MSRQLSRALKDTGCTVGATDSGFTGGAARGADDETAMRRVWDVPVRLCHWGLVLTMAGAYATNRMGVSYFKYHVWCGYAVIVLVSFRILWGVFGTRHARFSSFVRSPRTIWRYAVGSLRGVSQRYVGHNPLGALMVLVLLSALLTQAVTGLFANDEIFNFGPLAGYITGDRSNQVSSIHRQLFYWILGAVALHVLAVIAHRVFKKEPLVRAMLTGHKPAAFVAPHEEIRSSRALLAIAVILALCTALACVIAHAPPPVDTSSSF
jgi:cytochrome b